jgi:hypothetical protein
MRGNWGDMGDMTDDLTRPTETPPPAPPAISTPDDIAIPPADAPPPAGTEPVVATGSPGSNRVRWAIGIGVAALAVVIAIGAFILLGSRPAPEALKYIPADAALVAEIRMDLPGDQLQKLGTLLAHFPGFADQSTLPDKIDESLSRLLQQESPVGLDYRTDIKPWLSGPAFVAVWVPAGASASDMTEPPRFLVSATTTGTVSCAAPFKDQTVNHENYRGLDLFLGPGTEACVTDGRQALIGDVASIKAGLDAHGDGSGVDRSDAYRAARAALQGDQLAAIYVSGRSYSAFFGGVAGSSLGAESGMSDLLSLAGSIPEWAISGVRAEDDALVVDSVTSAPPAPTPGATAGPSLLPVPPAHPSVIAPMAPANTIAFVEAQGAGVTLQNLLARLKSVPELAPGLQLLDGAGGAAQLVGWVDDAGVIVLSDGGKPTGGIALVTKDEASATQRVATLNSLIGLLAISAEGIKTRESTIAGVTVTTITVTDLGSLIPPGSLPSGQTLPANASFEFSIAAKGRVVLVGTGEDFMTAVLNVQAGASLADQAFYKKALSRAVSNPQLTVYVGVRDLVGLAETLMPADAKARWESDIKPYVAPFEALSITASSDASGSRQRLTITVSNP